MDDFLDPREAPPAAIDAVAAAQVSLREHRATTDARAVELQRLEISHHRFRCTWAGALLAALVAPGLTGDTSGVVTGAIAGMAAAQVRWCGCARLVTVVIAVAPTAIWALARLVTGQQAAPSFIVVAVCASALVAIGGLIAWALDPPPGSVVSTRPWSLLRRFARPDELIDRANHAAALSEVNQAAKACRLRWLRLRCVTIGASAAWVVAPAFGFGSGGALGGVPLGYGTTPMIAVIQAWCAVPCAIAAGVIAWWEWGPLRSMALYGGAFFLASFSGLLLGLTGISVLIALWLWAGGVIAGYLLSLVVEEGDLAVAQRTT